MKIETLVNRKRYDEMTKKMGRVKFFSSEMGAWAIYLPNILFMTVVQISILSTRNLEDSITGADPFFLLAQDALLLGEVIVAGGLMTSYNRYLIIDTKLF